MRRWRVVGSKPHSCLRDTLPRHMYPERGRARDGQFIECDVCGKIWLCQDGSFARFRRATADELAALDQGET